MVLFILVSHLLAALVAGAIGRLLGRPREMIAAFVMIAVFGNIGNYGLAVIGFHLGGAALLPATIYFVAITLNAFVVCVAAAGWAQGGSRKALRQVLMTPALWAAVLALIISGTGVEPPLLLERMLALLGAAMIPVMLFALGLQLREQGRVQCNVDVLLASGLRLLLTPALTAAVALLIPLTSLERVTGILQAGMPTAILVAIIARENNIVPAFVSSVVVVSTLISLLTLTLMMVFI
jgi:predicted permease